MDFEAYVRQSRLPLLRFAVVLTDDPELAQDVVHDVLLKAQKRWRDIAGTDHPHAYVRRMLVNEVTSWRRKWSRIEARPDEAIDRPVSDPTTAIDRRDALIRELSRLPVRQRAVLVMRYFEDMPDAEIADVLGCGVATVRVHAHRGLAAMRVQRSGAGITT